uniref:FBD domain-containing protein n=1 Tax=Brassica oleracea var. oleracea TaxID=109376 RepID=A0A0D2ZSY5_BRAOL
DYEVYSDKVENESYNDRVAINVPSSKYLNYVDIFDYGHLCLSEYMPQLVEAHVKLVCNSPEKLMRSLTAVKRLSLCLFNHSMVQLKVLDVQNEHQFAPSPRWITEHHVTWILKSSPKLQVLMLNQNCTVKPVEGRWGQLSSVPECLTFHLNTFEWNYYNGRREEKKLVAFILRTAKRLKTAQISAWDLDSEEKSQILKELASLHRASNSLYHLLRINHTLPSILRETISLEEVMISSPDSGEKEEFINGWAVHHLPVQEFLISEEEERTEEVEEKERQSPTTSSDMASGDPALEEFFRRSQHWYHGDEYPLHTEHEHKKNPLNP